MKTSKYKGPEPQWTGRKPAHLTNQIREWLETATLDENHLITDLSEQDTKVFAARIKSEARTKFNLRADVANHEKGFVVRLTARPVDEPDEPDEPATESDEQPASTTGSDRGGPDCSSL